MCRSISIGEILDRARVKVLHRGDPAQSPTRRTPVTWADAMPDGSASENAFSLVQGRIRDRHDQRPALRRDDGITGCAEGRVGDAARKEALVDVSVCEDLTVRSGCTRPWCSEEKVSYCACCARLLNRIFFGACELFQIIRQNRSRLVSGL
ncbi:hypothetical protein MRX96_037608 [Rhipicephalus microplus]